MMNTFLLFLAFCPLFSFLVSLFLPHQEKWISRFVLFAVLSHTLAVQASALFWLFSSSSVIFYKGPAIYSSGGIEFLLSLFFDKVTALFLTIGSILTALIVIYSRAYLHREEGYKRFFSTILLFSFGYNLIVLSGNFEVLFVGWEILGISSFLLIGFYRDRYLPIKNALKVFSIYRFGDVGLILTTWICHLLWERNIQFSELASLELLVKNSDLSGLYFFLTMSLLLSAAAKSAQFPFCSWLPRAMEGPTPSSAIFYGSLSIHIGAFILLRTAPLWENHLWGRLMIVAVGVLTALMCNGSARVQPTIKSQIAYSSLTQIGLIFVEIGFGFHNLALIHIAGNAFLRTYQLLVSPSVVSYLLREQLYKPLVRQETLETYLSTRWASTLYILSLREWTLDQVLERILWSPFKKAGTLLHRWKYQKRLLMIVVAGLVFWGLLERQKMSQAWLAPGLTAFIALIGFLFVLRSLVERENPYFAWSLVFVNHIWILLTISSYEALTIFEVIVYLSGVVAGWTGGLYCLSLLKKKGRAFDLQAFHGAAEFHPHLAFWFLLSCLALSGFPISPTFIGEDVVFHHIHREQVFVALLISLSYIFDGLCILRIYARLFLGSSTTTLSGVARRSS